MGMRILVENEIYYVLLSISEDEILVFNHTSNQWQLLMIRLSIKDFGYLPKYFNTPQNIKGKNKGTYISYH